MSDKLITTLYPHRCPVCKKQFIPAPLHAWNTGNKDRLVCSYTCQLECDRQRAKKKRTYVKHKEKKSESKD